MDYEIILGSQSPRRSDLLKQAGLTFKTINLNIDESYPDNLEPQLIAKYLSEKKSNAFEITSDKILLITADTTVEIEGQMLEKPKSITEATTMLHLLSGKTHKVITGVTIRSIKKTISFCETTEVTFCKLDPEEIDHYIQQYKPFDKAGSYGIQEWLGLIAVKEIKGSYFNVVGLPIHAVYQTIKTFKKI